MYNSLNYVKQIYYEINGTYSWKNRTQKLKKTTYVSWDNNLILSYPWVLAGRQNMLVPNRSKRDKWNNLSSDVSPHIHPCGSRARDGCPLLPMVILNLKP